MTVGISITNGKSLESIIVADSCSSMIGRESSSVRKTGIFERDGFHGVVFGSGNGNFIEAVTRSLDTTPGDNLDHYVATIQVVHKARFDREVDTFYHSASKGIEQRIAHMHPSRMIADIHATAKLMPEQNQAGYIQQAIGQASQRHSQVREQEFAGLNKSLAEYKNRNSTALVIVAYDKKLNQVRKFHITEHDVTELHSDHVEIGSGMDGANLYMAQNLQGIDKSVNLKRSDLAFFAVNAYCSSTVNSGVSGTPSIVSVSADGVHEYSREKTCALVNLGGAFLSRFNEAALTHESTRDYVSRIISNDRGVYREVARDVKQGVTPLKSLAIPYSTWQEAANARLFK